MPEHLGTDTTSTSCYQGDVLLLLPFYPMLYIWTVHRWTGDLSVRSRPSDTEFSVCAKSHCRRAQHQLLPLDKIAPFLTGEGDPVWLYALLGAYGGALPVLLIGLAGALFGLAWHLLHRGIPNVISAFA